MGFNVNYFAGTLEGLIPLNPDSWFKARGAYADSYQNGNPVFNYSRYSSVTNLFSLMEAYWRVRSFEVDIRINITKFGDTFGDFVRGGGTAGGVQGSLGGIANTANSVFGSSVLIKDYTQTFHRYYDTVLEGKKNTPKVGHVPNPEQSFINAPNEGTLVSPGPVHILRNNFRNGNASLKIDFSDIVYKNGFYFPNIYFNIQTTKFSATTDFRSSQAHDTVYMYFAGVAVPIWVTIFDRDPNAVYITNGYGEITPGERCCDRYLWDGKSDKNCEFCNDKYDPQGDPSKNGVYVNPVTYYLEGGAKV